ncbi:gamma-glutamylcyclotransferase [Lentzea tibetensis]|uniref:Gamma-glutamylcyclotransferase n=1 Tax=Lentzea tibetensis TaxID=2591470 RepID=A0A563EQS4_9PSEU|nr:gamma-glutamylcyclotransferase [Lentzea tibetensis]TWP49977.1 gamma-glutamylcyclotransferase [Lentzea tibetensis]
MAQPFTDDRHPAEPYPGTRPEHCFVHLDETGWPVTPDLAMESGWRVEPENVDLDQWLADRGEPPLAGRMPVLGYGSNANPSKVTWLRDELGLVGPAVVLRARCEGLAAVWAAGLRTRDGQRCATLAAAPGSAEEHSVWFATPEQLRVLDRCEGRGLRYRLVRLHTGRVTLQNGGVIDSVLAYTAASKNRLPVLFNGRMVRCSEIEQEYTRHLGDRPVPSDGLDVTEVHGAPSADDWPELLFVYGTLMPGASAWHLMEPHVTGTPDVVRLAGTLHDTGLGYPAFRPGTGPGVPGYVVRLRSPEDALPLLDEYEGDEYRRVRVVLPGGRIAWTYLWTSPIENMPVLPDGWVH